MSSEMVRILIAGALFVHGIGHTMGFWKPARSIPRLKITTAGIRNIARCIWALVAIGFILSAMSFFGIIIPAGWWRPLAIIFSVLSLLGLFLFGRSWPVFNIIGASAMNIAVLVALLWLDWPPYELFGK